MKLKAVYVDVHGTIMPKYSTIKDIDHSTDPYWKQGIKGFLALNQLCHKQGIKLVIISGGTVIEVRQLTSLFPAQVSAYYAEQGAIRSIDGGTSWTIMQSVVPNIRQLNLQFITALKAIDITVLDQSYRLILSTGVVSLAAAIVANKQVVTIAKAHDYKTYVISHKNSTMKWLVVRAEVNKYAAIKDYKKLYNLAEEQTLFYGNGTNDWEAFVQGTHHKLLSTTPELFEQITEIPRPDVPMAKQPLVFGLLQHIQQLLRL